MLLVAVFTRCAPRGLAGGSKKAGSNEARRQRRACTWPTHAHSKRVHQQMQTRMAVVLRTALIRTIEACVSKPGKLVGKMREAAATR